MVSIVFKFLNNEEALVRIFGSYVSSCVRALKCFLALNTVANFPS